MFKACHSIAQIRTPSFTLFVLYAAANMACTEIAYDSQISLNKFLALILAEYSSSRMYKV